MKRGRGRGEGEVYLIGYRSMSGLVSTTKPFPAFAFTSTLTLLEMSKKISRKMRRKNGRKGDIR